METVVSSNSQGIIIKSLVKICSEKSLEVNLNWGNRLKEFITVCQRRFGHEFSNKILTNAKIMEIMS